MFLKVLSIFIFLFSITLLAKENSFYQTLSGDDLLEVHFKKEIMLKSESVESFEIDVDKVSKSNCALDAESKKEEIYVSAGSKWKVKKTYLDSTTRGFSDLSVHYELTNKVGKLINLTCKLNLSGNLYIRLQSPKEIDYDGSRALLRKNECLKMGGTPEKVFQPRSISFGSSRSGVWDIDCYKKISPITTEIFKEKFKTVGISLVFKETKGKEIWTTDSVKKSSPAKTKSNN